MQDLDAALAQRDAASKKMDDLYRQMEAQLRQKDARQEQLLGQTSDHLNDLQKEITFREQEIASLQGKIRDREMHCDAALVSDTLNKQNLSVLKTASADKDQ